jgi:Flp pilus assembly protein TadG
MVEGALVTTTFIFLVVGITDFGRLGFAYNSVTYAAHRAARFAATRGSGSGHAASVADIQANAQGNIVALDPGSLAVNVTWTPDNNPGSQVQVAVTYSFRPLLIPISAGTVTLKSTSNQIITQ